MGKEIECQFYSSLKSLKKAPNSPSRNILRSITTFRLIVEDLASRTAKFTWLNAVQADIELLTILWMWKVWMGNDLTRIVILLLLLGTLESIDELFSLIDAALASCILGPHTRSGVFVKVKSTSALVLNVVTVDARVESMTIGWIGMGEETVLAWTVVVLALWWLCSCAMIRFWLVKRKFFIVLSHSLRNSVRSPHSMLNG